MKKSSEIWPKRPIGIVVWVEEEIRGYEVVSKRSYHFIRRQGVQASGRRASECGGVPVPAPAGVGRAAVLHLPLRLRKERGVGSSLAMDPLRAAVWNLAAAALDHTGRRLSGRRDRPVCIELYYRWFRSGMVADRGGVLCAVDGVSTDC